MSARLAAIGHSLGGWTVMELAGARFDAGRFQRDCKNHAVLASCKLIPALGIDRPAASGPLMESQREPRINAVVSLDLGLARGFTPGSLAQLNVPVLILSAQADSDALPARLESGYLQRYIPAAKQQAQSVTGATHFSFMQLCKPGAKALIEEHDPGEGIVCDDGGSLMRPVSTSPAIPGLSISLFITRRRSRGRCQSCQASCCALLRLVVPG